MRIDWGCPRGKTEGWVSDRRGNYVVGWADTLTTKQAGRGVKKWTQGKIERAKDKLRNQENKIGELPNKYGLRKIPTIGAKQTCEGAKSHFFLA